MTKQRNLVVDQPRVPKRRLSPVVMVTTNWQPSKKSGWKRNHARKRKIPLLAGFLYIYCGSFMRRTSHVTLVTGRHVSPPCGLTRQVDHTSPAPILLAKPDCAFAWRGLSTTFHWHAIPSTSVRVFPHGSQGPAASSVRFDQCALRVGRRHISSGTQHAIATVAGTRKLFRRTEPLSFCRCGHGHQGESAS
jgi:hypothetical protein